jgi:hypothetical protein
MSRHRNLSKAFVLKVDKSWAGGVAPASKHKALISSTTKNIFLIKFMKYCHLQVNG